MGLDIYLIQTTLPTELPDTDSDWSPSGEWVRCSPEWEACTGVCEHAPRIDHHPSGQHYHPPVEKKIHYFRKFNAFWRWVNGNITEVVNQENIPLTREHLQQLHTLLTELTKENCSERFPVTDGFYFGSQEYGADYWPQVNGLRLFVHERLQSFDFSKFQLCFHAWW